MARPIVALLSDFGTQDHYAGAMKAVVLTVCPDATLVDIIHEIPPHNVLAGALELAACYRYFPPGTVFLVVVDPGVGSARRGIAAEVGGHVFVAPDNGVLSAVFHDAPPGRIVELTERQYARPVVSGTFEGRDRFAPAAGWLASGLELTRLGRAVTDYESLTTPAPTVGADRLVGEVIRVDRFGNLGTNIGRPDFERLAREGPVVILAGGHDIPRVVTTYSEAGAGGLCALIGSTEQLEVAVSGGSAAAALGLGRGGAVEVVRR